MPERVLSDIIQLIMQRHPKLIWHHCRDGRGCAGNPGLPDLIIIGPKGKILYREVKPHRGAHLPADQVTWKWALVTAGADWKVWTAEDLSSGAIHEELRQLA